MRTRTPSILEEVDALARVMRSGLAIDDALATTSPAGLLTAVEQLTHRLHDATGDAERNLRAQRLLVRNELLRRMGEAR